MQGDLLRVVVAVRELVCRQGVIRILGRGEQRGERLLLLLGVRGEVHVLLQVRGVRVDAVHVRSPHDGLVGGVWRDGGLVVPRMWSFMVIVPAVRLGGMRPRGGNVVREGRLELARIRTSVAALGMCRVWELVRLPLVLLVLVNLESGQVLACVARALGASVLVAVPVLLLLALALSTRRVLELELRARQHNLEDFAAIRRGEKHYSRPVAPFVRLSPQGLTLLLQGAQLLRRKEPVPPRPLHMRNAAIYDARFCRTPDVREVRE
jgi:hypothetical protein